MKCFFCHSFERQITIQNLIMQTSFSKLNCSAHISLPLEMVIDSQVCRIPLSLGIYGNWIGKTRFKILFSQVTAGSVCEWVCTFIMAGYPCNAFVNYMSGCCFSARESLEQSDLLSIERDPTRITAFSQEIDQVQKVGT